MHLSVSLGPYNASWCSGGIALILFTELFPKMGSGVALETKTLYFRYTTSFNKCKYSTKK